MSVKLHELCLQAHDGKLIIGKKNKRGNIQDYIDISTPITKRVVEILITKPDYYIHQEVVDPETKEVKHFKIICNEMTPEEISTYHHNKKVSKEKGMKSFTSLFNMMLGSFGGKNMFFNK
jgi:hypothetical protein